MKKAKTYKLKRVLIVGLCLYATVSLIKQEFALRDLKQEKLEKQAELERIETETAEIKKKVDNREDIAYIEKIARDELDMVRPNEIIYEDKNASEAEGEPDKE